ncbi:MAG: hypothetical protein P1Q69_20400, partial [Candidatus Thorarchaeota archaeon]|nr:hypothetical protein [Candidatus Thorarchaeota archaeon]
MFEEHDEHFEEEESLEDEETTPSEVVEKIAAESIAVRDEPESLLGASESELDVYSLIIAYGNATLGDISLLSKGMSIDQIGHLIDGLKDKKMIVELPGLVPRYLAVPPFDGLAEEVN